MSETATGLTADLRELCRTIYENPELGYHEFRAAEAIAAMVEKYGIAVERRYCGLETAFRADFGSADGPVFAFPAEYDALAGAGHACGHNLIATAAVAAFLSTAAALAAEKLPGRAVLLGTPAEETYGGKIELLNRGGFAGIDSCMLSHPFRCSAIDRDNLAVSRYDVTFSGTPAHAAAAPEQGVNALDAMTLLLTGIGLYRQQMPQGCRIHGIVTDGGQAPNIIPGRTTAFYYLRADRDEKIARLAECFRRMAEGAALMTGCRAEVTERDHAYLTSRTNAALNAAAAEAMTRAGLEPQTVEERISSDYGNVSQVIPGVNIFFGIFPPGEATAALHSGEFQKAAGTEFAFRQALKTGEAMKEVALRYFRDAVFRRAVQDAAD